MKKRKRRSIAASRAASLKGARTRQRMKVMRFIATDTNSGPMTIRGQKLRSISDLKGPVSAGDLVAGQAYLLDTTTMTLKPLHTIDLIPKVQWP